MKKMVPLILIICMMFSINVFADSAADEQTPVFYYENKEIVLENNDLNQAELQRIADFVAVGDAVHITHEGVTTYGLACLFGHNLTTSKATETTHNAYATSPKCLLQKYEVTTCTRSSCDYMEKTLISSERTNECHG
jgi:hypothetical protein